jgi:hypothetical protein
VSVSIVAPIWGKMERRSFLRVFERREKFIYLFIWENFYKEFERHVKKCLVNGQLSP